MASGGRDLIFAIVRSVPFMENFPFPLKTEHICCPSEVIQHNTCRNVISVCGFTHLRFVKHQVEINLIHNYSQFVGIFKRRRIPAVSDNRFQLWVILEKLIRVVTPFVEEEDFLYQGFSFAKNSIAFLLFWRFR